MTGTLRYRAVPENSAHNNEINKSVSKEKKEGGRTTAIESQRGKILLIAQSIVDKRKNSNLYSHGSSRVEKFIFPSVFISALKFVSQTAKGQINKFCNLSCLRQIFCRPGIIY